MESPYAGANRCRLCLLRCLRLAGDAAAAPADADPLSAPAAAGDCCCGCCCCCTGTALEPPASIAQTVFSLRLQLPLQLLLVLLRTVCVSNVHLPHRSTHLLRLPQQRLALLRHLSRRRCGCWCELRCGLRRRRLGGRRCPYRRRWRRRRRCPYRRRWRRRLLLLLLLLPLLLPLQPHP